MDKTIAHEIVIHANAGALPGSLFPRVVQIILSFIRFYSHDFRFASCLSVRINYFPDVCLVVHYIG